jgi:hypothetical protein
MLGDRKEVSSEFRSMACAFPMNPSDGMETEVCSNMQTINIALVVILPGLETGCIPMRTRASSLTLYIDGWLCCNSRSLQPPLQTIQDTRGKKRSRAMYSNLQRVRRGLTAAEEAKKKNGLVKPWPGSFDQGTRMHRTVGPQTRPTVRFPWSRMTCGYASGTAGVSETWGVWAHPPVSLSLFEHIGTRQTLYSRTTSCLPLRSHAVRFVVPSSRRREKAAAKSRKKARSSRA